VSPWDKKWAVFCQLGIGIDADKNKAEDGTRCVQVGFLSGSAHTATHRHINSQNGTLRN